MLRRCCHIVRAKPLGAVGGLCIVLLVGMALFAAALAPYDPIQIKSADRLHPPSTLYPLGTDDFGRDILSRVIYGARISMLIGLGAVMISTVLATLLGVLSGFYGGKVDTVLQRGVDTLMAFPGLVVLLTIMAILGQGLGNVILALGIGGTAGNTRIIRSAVLTIKENAYIEAARALGCRELAPDPALHPAQHRGADYGCRHARPGDGDSGGSVPQLLRLWRPAPNPIVGRDAERLGPDVYAEGPVDGDLSGSCAQPGGLSL